MCLYLHSLEAVPKNVLVLDGGGVCLFFGFFF